MTSAIDTLQRIRRDPVWFCREVLGFEPWSKQREVLEAVRDHPRVAVRSAHGVGKTAVAARVVLWFLAAFPRSIVVTTSATWGQVREQLWREVAVAFHASGGWIDGVLTDTRLELGPDHFAIGLSTDTPERFAGWHAENLLVVLDEASGVNEAVWEAAETLTTSPGSKLLAIGNPTRLAGSFHRAFTSERDLYKTIHVSALDSPAVTGEPVSASVMRQLVGPDWIEGRRRAWGERSAPFQVRVLGQFASTADDSVCALADVEAAQRRKQPRGVPVIVACDVARFGSDETVIAVRFGGRVRIESAYVGRDLMRTAGTLLRVARSVTAESGVERATIIVDDVGLGGGLVDRLQEIDEFPVLAFNGAHSAHDPAEYPNRRSEAWFSFAEQLPEVDLPADEQLVADLVAPRYTIDSRGRRVVEAKGETKKRLGRSPDRADAVLMAFSVRASAWPTVEYNDAPVVSLTGDLLDPYGPLGGGIDAQLAWERFVGGGGR